MNAEEKADAQPAVVTSSGYVLQVDEQGQPIIPELGEKVYRQPSVLSDCFAGIAAGGIVCASHGLRWIGVELESEATGGSPFVELARKNFELHRRTWEAFSDPQAVIVQGDSREFASIAAGKVDSVICSPPYAESIGRENAIDYSKAKGPHDGLKPSPARDALGGSYGTSPGQLGNTSGPTYWSEMATIWESVHAALKPNGILAVVVKAYVSKGQIVDLPGDTVKLLESIGFHVFEVTRAWLVKEDRHPSLFGGDVVKRTKRVSFFRRLAEAKGSPPIDYECVIWARRVDTS